MPANEYRILVLNGPNLNLIGTREVKIYGTNTLQFINDSISKFTKSYQKATDLKIQLSFSQSNYEGDIIEYIHDANSEGFNGILLNPGALSHYSYALGDAISAVNIPIIEIHISNTFSREEFRHKSVISRFCSGIVVGFGIHSYTTALIGLLEILKDQNK